jgi:hypothetical protein
LGAKLQRKNEDADSFCIKFVYTLNFQGANIGDGTADGAQSSGSYIMLQRNEIIGDIMGLSKCFDVFSGNNLQITIFCCIFAVK